MKYWVETLEAQRDVFGKPTDVGWRTDGRYSRYWAGRRFAELNERGQVCRVTDQRGNVLQSVT